jgi:hypothetical protein
LRAEARLLARHEFERAVHPEVQDHVGGEAVAEPEVELDEGMGRREAAFEEKPHRVAFPAEGRLDAHEDVAHLLAEDEDPAPVRLEASRGGAPDRLDRVQVLRVAHHRVGVHMGRDVGLLPVGLELP